MKKAILVNFHVKYAKPCAPDSEDAKPSDKDVIAKFGEDIGLEQQDRSAEEMQAREDKNRAEQNPQAKARDKADSGTLVMDAETRVKLEEFVRDLTASGYKLVDAYWQHKHQFVQGKATGLVNGRVYRLVFAIDQEQIMSEEDALELMEDLLAACKTFVCPCVNVWDNPTSQTVNVGHNFKRVGAPSHRQGDKSLRFRLGEYSYEPMWRHKPYVAPPRVQ